MNSAVEILIIIASIFIGALVGGIILSGAIVLAINIKERIIKHYANKKETNRTRN